MPLSINIDHLTGHVGRDQQLLQAAAVARQECRIRSLKQPFVKLLNTIGSARLVSCGAARLPMRVPTDTCCLERKHMSCGTAVLSMVLPRATPGPLPLPREAARDLHSAMKIEVEVFSMSHCDIESSSPTF